MRALICDRSHVSNELGEHRPPRVVWRRIRPDREPINEAYSFAVYREKLPRE